MIVVWSPVSVEGAAFSVENSSDVAVSVTQKGVFAPPVPSRSTQIHILLPLVFPYFLFSFPLLLPHSLFTLLYTASLFSLISPHLSLLSSSLPSLLSSITLLFSILTSSSYPIVLLFSLLSLPRYRGVTEPVNVTDDNDPARYVLDNTIARTYCLHLKNIIKAYLLRLLFLTFSFLPSLYPPLHPSNLPFPLPLPLLSPLHLSS